MIVGRGTDMNRMMIVILTMLAACGSCSHYADGNFGGRPLTDDVARDSVYKVTITQVLDTSSFPPELGLGATQDVGHMGTAWVVGHKDNATFLLTAGHICDNATTVEVSKAIPALNVVSTHYNLISRDGTEFSGVTVVNDDDDHDLCLLTVAGDLGPAIPLGSDPEYGQHVRYIGAPHGHWGGGLAPIFEGIFAGRGYPYGMKTGTDPSHERIMVTVNAAGGASGSPIMYRGSAIGILVSTYTDTSWEVAAVPADQIKKFIEISMAVEP